MPPYNGSSQTHENAKEIPAVAPAAGAKTADAVATLHALVAHAMGQPSSQLGGDGQSAAPSSPQPAVDDFAGVAPDDPFQFVRDHLAARMLDGVPTIRYHHGDFLAYSGGTWRELDEQSVDDDLIGAIHTRIRCLNLEAALTIDKPPAPRRFLMADLAASKVVLRREVAVGTEPIPTWVAPGYDHPADSLIAAPNGLVPIASLVARAPVVLPPTPRHFTRTAVDYEIPAAVGEPTEWFKFLNSLWPDEPESIETLKRWFGYILSGKTHLQKILVFLGPPRSGRGTICRVLTRMLGEANVCSPTLGGLAGQFGLASLVGKSLAIVGDARVSGRTDSAVVVERLNGISGEDPQDVERKYKASRKEPIGARLMIVSNEMPRLPDASGALVARFVVLRLTESHVGREDRGLEARLMAELPAILCWSAQGLREIEAGAELGQPESGLDLLDGLDELGSPIKTFAAGCCNVGPEHTVFVDELYREWCGWCESHGHEPGSSANLGKLIRAAEPKVKKRQSTRNGRPAAKYQGIGLVGGRGPLFPEPSAVTRERDRREAEAAAAPHYDQSF